MWSQRKNHSFCVAIYTNEWCTQQRTEYGIEWRFSLFHKKPHETAKRDTAPYGQSIVTEILRGKQILCFCYEAMYGICCLTSKLYHITNKKEWRKYEYEKEKGWNVSKRDQVLHRPSRHDHEWGVDYLADEYGWSSSVPNLSGKLKRGSLRYGEAVELANALGYDIVWVKRGWCDWQMSSWKNWSTRSM